MPKVLACRVFARELRYLRPDLSADYFEPMCHRLQPAKFAAYVESQIKGHTLLVCGDCGGLAAVAERGRIRILPGRDCIDLLLPERQAATVYLTGGWLENLDVIFGLEGKPRVVRDAVLRALLSGVRKVVYVRTLASKRGESKAEALARMLGCKFESIEGSLDALSKGLQEAGA